MSREEILALVKYRLEQAQTALDDGRFLEDFSVTLLTNEKNWRPKKCSLP